MSSDSENEPDDLSTAPDSFLLCHIMLQNGFAVPISCTGYIVLSCVCLTMPVFTTSVGNLTIIIDHFTFGAWSIDDSQPEHENGAWFAKCRA